MFRSTLICFAVALAGLASLVASATTAAGQRPQGKIIHWWMDGVRRDALVFAPRLTHGSAKHPLVIAFHGHGGHMQSTSVLMRIQTLWPEAIVVYPQGLNTPTIHDPAGTMPGWQGKAGDFGDRDLKLFDAIVATMKESYAVNERRIYATGFSNGAVFSLLLWAERAKTVAAISEVAGRLDPSETLTSPRALLAIAGRSDMVAPFAVQKQTIQQAREINGASGRGSSCGKYCRYYPSVFGLSVKTFIHPGGHEYPTWAPAEIVNFLKSRWLAGGSLINGTRRLVAIEARRLPVRATP
jgi:polyhydroxybutyrate depolymerase